jgi:hypothetical protein
VLENPNNGPPLVAKFTVGVGVAHLVCFEFGDPPLSVLFGRCAMFRARMPKAAVHEDCELLGRKNDIDAPAVAYDSSINEEPQSYSM